MRSRSRREVTLGVVATAIALGAAALFGHGLGQLFIRPEAVRMPLLLIAGATGLRFIGSVVTAYALQHERARRTLWITDRLWGHIRTPGRRDVVGLDRAATAARQGVGVEYLATSAGTALVALVPVWIFGGWLSAAIFVALIGLSVPFYIRAGRAAESSSAAVADRMATLATLQLRTIDAMSDMRSLGTIDYASQRLEAASTAASSTALAGIRRAMGSSLITDFIGGAAIGLVAMVVGFDLLHARRSLDHSLVALFLVVEMNGRVRAWASAFHQREDAARSETLLSEEPATLKINDSGRHLLAVRGVNFPPFTNVITLTVDHGDRIALSGPSGVGKTTLLQGFVGLAVPPMGDVAVTTEPIGWVRADSQFFAGTLRDNLCVRRPVETSDVIDILERLGLTGPRFSALDGAVISASQLSDGERARLAIARSLLAEVSLLILDDVAGLFDDETMLKVATEIERRPAMAVIEAAHDRRLLRDPTSSILLEPR